MKEIRLCFYKSQRKNCTCFVKSYCIYNGFKNGKNKFCKADFIKAVQDLTIYRYKYITIAMSDYNSFSFFNPNDKTKSNFLNVAESKRFNVTNRNDLIEIIKLLYWYMILLGADFDYNYNPFIDTDLEVKQ